MSDTTKYLPESRNLFRKFVKSHAHDIYVTMQEAKVGPGTGYWYFYRDSEVIQHIRDIYHNLTETFGGVTIPDEFPAPKRLVEVWKSFYDFLNLKNSLFEDVYKTLKSKKESNPEPLNWIYKIHKDVLSLMEEIVGMDEVKQYLDIKNTSKKAVLKEEHFDIVIITALYDTEFTAFEHLPIKLFPYPEPNDPTQYYKSIIGTKSILFVTDDKMGMVAAASLCTKVIAKFSPQYLIMGGIAGGVKDEEKNYGDILVARYTWNYESGKYKFSVKTGGTVFEPNPEQIELVADLVRIINEMESDKLLLNSIKNGFSVTKNDLKPDATLKVFMGPVASGSGVLGDERKIERIRKRNRKLIGIDMETYAVMYAAKSFSNNNELKAISIKSISDFADQRKSDKYRNYAAYTSANFIYQLILNKLQ